MPSNEDLILSNLNPAQREAVETLEGPLLIVAGAGSGKTRVVTHRIANLIDHGVRPWQILAITFTNKAAGEMRRRVERLVGTAGVWLSTFHSFCARLLRIEADALGISRDYTIYDEDDVKKVLDEIVSSQAGEDSRVSVRNIRPIISMLKSRGVGPQDMQPTAYHARLIQDFYGAYENALRANEALDFDDLLLNGVRLLREHDDVRERYRDRFRHILIDEYQDTNSCQYELVRTLGGGHHNVCATGDPDQSIYSWRGADIRNILSFEDDFPEAKIVRLEQNYRSTKRILSVASSVIRNNTQRKERELWTENAEGEKVKLMVLEDQELEAEAVVSSIADLVATGKPYKDFSIFYRTNAQSRPFEASFIRASIPYQIVGGTPFYERKEIKDALAYLRLILNPRDDISFRRVVNVPKRGIGRGTIDRIAHAAGTMGCSMMEALDRPEWIEKEIRPKPRKSLYEFARLMDRFREIPRYPVGEIVRRVLEESELMTAYTEAEELERVENLEQLLNAAMVYDRDNPLDAEPAELEGLANMEDIAEHRSSLGGFLENASLVQATDDIHDDRDRVSLMTLHMAKGLEFPFVYIVGVEDNLLPMGARRNDLSEVGLEEERDHEKDSLEEERRLFYVGVTRGEERVFLTRVRYRMRFGKTDFAIPSPFLSEVPEEHLEMDNRTNESDDERWDAGRFGFSMGNDRDAFAAYLSGGGRRRRGSPRRGRTTYFQDADEGTETPDDWGEESQVQEEMDYGQLESTDLAVGDHVQHDIFGKGTVLALTGLGSSSKAKVRFPKAGTKTLLLSMARLKKL